MTGFLAGSSLLASVHPPFPLRVQGRVPLWTEAPVLSCWLASQGSANGRHGWETGVRGERQNVGYIFPTLYRLWCHSPGWGCVLHYDSPCLHTVNSLESGVNTISSLDPLKPSGSNGFPHLLLPGCLSCPCWVPGLTWAASVFQN